MFGMRRYKIGISSTNTMEEHLRGDISTENTTREED